MLWIGLIFNLLQGLDRRIYDQIINFPGFKGANQSSVVLLEADPSFHYASAQVWLEILDKINRLKPKAVFIPFLPANWQNNSAPTQQVNYPLFVGQSIFASVKVDTDETEKLAVTELPPIDDNVYRQFWLFNQLNQNRYDSLVKSAAQKLTGLKFDPEQERFFIDFRQAKGRMPLVTMAQLQNQQLVNSLIEDKVIIFGYADQSAPLLSTPVGNISFAMYQSYALDTLLNDNQIKRLDLSLMLLITFLTVIILLFLVPRIRERYLLLSLIILCVLTMASSWFFLMFNNIWIRPGVIVLSEIAVFISLYYVVNQQHKRELREMALKSASSIEHRWAPSNFFTNDEHWTQITNMVSQTLSLKRLIFLERVLDDHRVKEIKALNCQIGDISEMRRDYHRTPYTTAVKKGGVIRLETEYLTKTDEDEVQYLVPLNFAGEIQGFWAFSIKADHHLDENKIIYTVEQFSSQIAEILFHRAQWVKHQSDQNKPLTRLLSLKFDESAYSSINRALNFLRQRLTVMDSVMDGMETSAILYDLFGRVVQVNKSMSGVLSDLELAPYSMTAADLISRLSCCSTNEARNYLSYIILDKGSVDLPIKNEQLKEGYMLSVRALINEEQVSIDGDVQPFEIMGILCELIDMSRISEIYSQKENVVEHLSSWLRNDLSSILIACDLVNDKRMPIEKKTTVMGIVKSKVETLAKSIERVNSIIQSDLVSQQATQYPVDCEKPLLEAIEKSRKKIGDTVTIITQFPHYMPLVVASANELQQLFNDLLKLLIADVVEDGKISIEISDQEHSLQFHFFNEGFGFPDQQLQDYLTSDDILDSDEFNSLRRNKRHIERWGGIFSASSAVGEGLQFTFTLEAFVANE